MGWNSNDSRYPLKTTVRYHHYMGSILIRYSNSSSMSLNEFLLDSHSSSHFVQLNNSSSNYCERPNTSTSSLRYYGSNDDTTANRLMSRWWKNAHYTATNSATKKSYTGYIIPYYSHGRGLTDHGSYTFG